MLELREITLQDKAWIQPIYDKASLRSMEYNFTYTYMWREHLSYKFAEMDGFLIQRSDTARGYLFPPGSGNVKPVIEAMIQDAKDRGYNFFFYTALAEQCKLLEVLFPDMFDFLPISKYNDYIYDAQSLITLTGKKYHAKRNYINRFKSLYPDWRYEPITAQNMPEVMAMSVDWCQRNDHGLKSMQRECRALNNILDDFFALGLDGGLIRAGEEVVAFSAGDKLTNDTYLVHLEKAYTEFHGAYAMINQQFAEHCAADYLYIDREDDEGNEGLRKAKLSYNPVMQIEKFAAKLR